MDTENVLDLDHDDACSSSSWEDVAEEMEDEGDGDVLQCHPLLMNSVILEKILEFLPTSDLLSCRLVNKEWNKTVLLRKLLGSKFEISVMSKGIFDGILKTGQNSVQPFCRRFNFRLIELEFDKVAKFIRLFGDRVSALSIKFCTASSPQPVVKILNCPRLEELTIYGALPDINGDNFSFFNFTRLRVLSLLSSLDYGQVSQQFIEVILNNAPNINSITVGQSMSLWTDFCKAIRPNTCLKLCHVGLSGIEGPLQIEDFQEFHEKKMILERLSIRNCLVSSTFLEQLLQQSFKHLVSINIEGTQQEILSRSFQYVTLPNLMRLSLPIDGVSLNEGWFILQSSPRLKRFKVVGQFETDFTFENGRLLSIGINEREREFRTSHVRMLVLNGGRPMEHEGNGVTREFLKVLSLFHLQPQTLQVNLTESKINSRCIRAIFNSFPELENLTLSTNCVKDCIVGFTGMPYRMCKIMANGKSLAVVQPQNVRMLPSAAKLTKLKSLDLTILDDPPSAEMTLFFIVYGISEIHSLEYLNLRNMKMSDVGFMVLAKKLQLLLSCKVNDSERHWQQFQTFFKKHTIKSFLLPPRVDVGCGRSVSESIGVDRKVVLKIFDNLSSNEIFESRNVCKYWQALSYEYLHQNCASEHCFTRTMEQRLSQYQRERNCPPSPGNGFLKYFGETRAPALAKVLDLWGKTKDTWKDSSIVLVSLSKSALDFFQVDNCRPVAKRQVTCKNRRQLEYWYYPDGTDELIYRPNLVQVGGSRKDYEFLKSISEDLQTLLVMGCWSRKDDALLEFFNPLWSTNSIHLIGLQKEALDLVLPKLTGMMNLESLEIKPFTSSSSYCELTKTHLQILCNASFKLRKLTLHLYAPSETVVEFVRSQRFTLETVELRSNVNISDRLTFHMPQLKTLLLDEPPGCLLWTTLHIHSSLETINFGRSSANTYCQVKNKSSPKVNPVEADFEHSATELLCDVNWFLENATSPRRTGAQKSILQQGSDSALKFFTHFPYLSSLTLRSVHAHYGILQGIFKKFGQLKKLELINATGVTDEILTGFSREILDGMDIMNPFQISKGKQNKTEAMGKANASIRNLKRLTHLSLDDQPACTDFSVLFGILKLHNLEYLSCKKWKITDISIRALADTLPSLKEVNTEGCPTVSKYAREYFDEVRCRNRTRGRVPLLLRSNSDSSTLSKSSSVSESDQSQKTEE